MAGITLPPDGNSAATRGSTRTETRATAAAPATPATSTEAEDKGSADTQPVRVSALARQAAAIEASIERSPLVDADRVSALRQAIRDGDYQVDTARLADAIVRLEVGR